MPKKSSPPKPVQPRGYRIEEWCQAFRTSRATAYDMMAAGKLKYVVIGGRRFIPNEEADRLLSERSA
jgi:predicted site-specific integrase-resolvase